ncbi:MAG: hypothetical protein WD270_07415 [Acetobacterales bacterium]
MKVTWETNQLGVREAHLDGKLVGRVMTDANASPNDRGAKRYSIEIKGQLLRGDKFRFSKANEAKIAVENLLEQRLRE